MIVLVPNKHFRHHLSMLLVSFSNSNDVFATSSFLSCRGNLMLWIHMDKRTSGMQQHLP